MKKCILFLSLLCTICFSSCNLFHFEISSSEATPTPIANLESTFLKISEIGDDYFIGVHLNETWTVYVKLAEEFCVGDNVMVKYSAKTDLGDNNYECSAMSVEDGEPYLNRKPVIYLYPTETTKVQVELDYQGELTQTIPKYQDGWNVTATPNGTLYDEQGVEYPYLFWEGFSNYPIDISKGYCIRGDETKQFLTKQLKKMGLSDTETQEFVEYWTPYLEQNPYNRICFQTKNYTDIAKLNITPAPDCMLRIQMVYEPLKEYVEMEPPEIEPFNRKGFTVIEWGGSRKK